MRKDYWFPWYPTRFKLATYHLDLEDDAIYRRLIDEYMVTGQPLPGNITALARIANTTEDKVNKALAKLSPSVAIANGNLVIPKCDEELAIQAARSEKNKRNGSEGGRAKAYGKQSKSSGRLAESYHKDRDNDKDIGSEGKPSSPAAASGFEAVFTVGLELFPHLAPRDSSIIRSWLNGGCDPELDIIPTFRRFVGKRDIGGWGYFTNMVTKAMKDRTAPLPDIQGTAKPAKKTDEERIQRLKELANGAKPR